MSKHEEVMGRILSGTSDANIAFQDLRHLLLRFGFEERIRGDHYIFAKDGIGAKAKPYQVR